jgi:hypothetical protein
MLAQLIVHTCSPTFGRHGRLALGFIFSMNRTRLHRNSAIRLYALASFCRETITYALRMHFIWPAFLITIAPRCRCPCRIQELLSESSQEQGRIPRTLDCELDADLVDSSVPVWADGQRRLCVSPFSMLHVLHSYHYLLQRGVGTQYSCHMCLPMYIFKTWGRIRDCAAIWTSLNPMSRYDVVVPCASGRCRHSVRDREGRERRGRYGKAQGFFFCVKK